MNPISQTDRAQQPSIIERSFDCFKSNIDKICLVTGAIFIVFGFLASSGAWQAAAFTVGSLLLAVSFIQMVRALVKNSSPSQISRPTENQSKNAPEKTAVQRIHTPNKTEMEPSNRNYLENITSSHRKQITQFREWARQKQWNEIRRAHYDWWMFPINRKGRGNASKPCIATPEVVEVLKADNAFMEEYREGVRLVCRAYGYDANRGKACVEPPSPLRDIRFGKMLSSLKWFGEKELHKNVATIVEPYSHIIEDWAQNDLKWETPLDWETSNSPSLIARQSFL